KLSLNNIELQDYQLEIREQLVTEAADTTTATAADFYKGMSAYLQEISVASLALSNAQLAYYNKSDKGTPLHSINKIDVALQEILLDSGSIFSPQVNLPLQELMLAAEGYTYQDAQNP